MRTRFPFHSAQAGQRVHHTNDECEAGQSIAYYWIRHNTGGLPQCPTCAALDLAAPIEDGLPHIANILTADSRPA